MNDLSLASINLGYDDLLVNKYLSHTTKNHDQVFKKQAQTTHIGNLSPQYFFIYISEGNNLLKDKKIDIIQNLNQL